MTFDYDPPSNFRDALDDDDPSSSDQIAELRRLGFRIVRCAPPTDAEVRMRIKEVIETDTSGVPHSALLAMIFEDKEALQAVHEDLWNERRFV